jgi:hypothetical protein
MTTESNAGNNDVIVGKQSSESILDKLKAKYVGKKITNDDYNQIVNAANNKTAYIIWLTVKIDADIILQEDVYKFEEYFGIFEKNKTKFSEKSIHKYETKEDVALFIQTCINVREYNIKFEDISDKDRYVSLNEIEKLGAVGIKYHGLVDEVQLFEIPNECKNSEEAWKVHREILARCKGREQGAKIEICTMASFSYFKQYLENSPNSSYWILFDLQNPLSPYQMHFESGNFKDKNDADMF